MATPRLVKDIRAGGSGSKITGLTTVGNSLYFQANDGVSGYELWKHDSSSLETAFEKTFGTALVKDIQPGQIDNGAFGGISPKGSFPSALTAVGSILYFSADDGVNGLELWKSDGTADGTTLVANINTSNSFPTKGTSIGNTLFFTAVSTQGRELMRTGGTPASTTVVKDIIADKFNVPGDYFSSNPNHLTAIGNTLYFTATDLFGA
jgi:ELWxxDGT repeat protein